MRLKVRSILHNAYERLGGYSGSRKAEIFEETFLTIGPGCFFPFVPLVLFLIALHFIDSHTKTKAWTCSTALEIPSNGRKEGSNQEC